MGTLVAKLGIPDGISTVAQMSPDVLGGGIGSFVAASLGVANFGGGVVFEPMRIWSDGDEISICNPDPDACDSDIFIVKTEIIAREFSAAGVASHSNSPLTDDTATMFKMLPVKAMVRGCGDVNRRIIDVGQPIAVRGPRASIAIVAPTSIFDLNRGLPSGGLEEGFEVNIYARACPCHCGLPALPTLTYFHAVAGGENLRNRVFVVPRGARSLIFGTFPAGPTNIQFWLGNPNSAVSTQLGAQPIIPSALFAAPIELSLFGGASHILIDPDYTAPGFVFMRWQIGDSP